MREADRNKELSFVLGAELDTEPFAECRGADAEIDRNIEDTTDSTSNELCHRSTHILIMHPAKDAITGSGVRILYKFMRQTSLSKILLVPALNEKAAFVLKVVDIYENKSRKRRFGHPSFHCLSVLVLSAFSRTNPNIRAGPPVPFSILIGATITNPPAGGIVARLATFSRWNLPFPWETW